MSTSSLLAAEYLRELEAEASATRACLENVPMEIPDWKPHEKSMQLGHLAILVADIPKWIQQMIDIGVIDFATYEQFRGTTTNELVAHFDANMDKARKSLGELTDEGLTKDFVLKNNDEIYMKTPVGETISSTINHMVHHRGQLSVYLRLNDAAVPSIYGPSADSPGF